MPTSTPAPTPAEQLAKDIQSLHYEVNQMQGKVRLASLRDDIEDVETSAGGLENRIRDLRGRGYAFEKSLETEAHELRRRWSSMRLQAQQQITQQAVRLEAEMRSVEALMAQLSARSGNPTLARPMLSQAKTAAEALESKIDATQSSISGMYDSMRAEVTKFCKHLDEVDWMMTQLAQACFRLLETECGIMAVEAVWAKDGKENKNDPQGVLYLTDQRILFEQKQDMATKKILFITTEKQKVQQLLLQIPLALMESVKASKMGLFNHEDHLDLTFASGAPFATLHFHIDGQESQTWHALLNRARTSSLDQDRAIAIDEKAEEKVKTAPTQCPACGGTLNQPVLRGMDTLTCPYCGHVMRLG